MRFRFCGDLDCPDWILAEINTLARVTSIKMKLVCQQVVKSLLGEDIDFDRVKKLTADAKFEPSEVKATVAALLFVLETSARHGVDGETLGSELQQLGLPREHAAALCRVYSDNLPSISSRLQDQSLRLSRLQDVQWRMDTVVVDKNQMVGELRVGLRVFCPASGTHHTHNFNIGAKQLHLLLADLKMDDVKSEPDSESDREFVTAQYEPQFIKVKEEHMPEDDDDDSEEDETSHTIRSDEDCSDVPDEEMAEAVMFPIVKTEYDTTDTSQKDGADEHAFGAVNDDKFQALEAPSTKDDLSADESEYMQDKHEVRLEDLKKQDLVAGSGGRASDTQHFRYTGHFMQQNDERRDQMCSQCGATVKGLSANTSTQNNQKVLCKTCIRGGSSSAKLRGGSQGSNVGGSVEKSFSCEFCKKEFQKHEYLMKHLRVHNEGNPFKCDVCGESFSRYGDLKRHSVEHNGGKPYECKFCNRRFSEKGNLKTHSLMHTGNMPYQCHFCQKQFPHNAYLIGHLRIHTGEKPYECHICNKRFTHNSGLKTHIRVHTGEKRYHCTVCDKVFSTTSILNTHFRIHTGEKPYQCQTCKKCFRSSSNLKMHTYIHTGGKSYKCKVCEKIFSTTSSLNLHMLRVHSGKKEYQCSVCEKRFSDVCKLKTHSRIHAEEKPYACNICDKRFSHRPNLNLHIRTHTGEKPYSCDVCEKRFSSSSALTSHARIHTGEKKYQCTVCNKLFANSSTLVTHSYIHSGEKPYECDVCKKRFRSNSNLRTHSYIHTGGRRYTCAICNSHFSSKSNLNTHSLHVHKIIKQLPPNRVSRPVLRVTTDPLLVNDAAAESVLPDVPVTESVLPDVPVTQSLPPNHFVTKVEPADVSPSDTMSETETDDT